MNLINRKALGTICLMIATFLNPFGFDILVYKLTELTKDYWNTMYVLYASALLLFGLSYLFFKLNKKVIGNIIVTLAMFVNPLGYDVVVYGMTRLTQDYWITMIIMYGLALTFYSLFIYLYEIKIVGTIKSYINITKNKLTTKTKYNG